MSKGFSLIETMVVVAIFAILAAIAVPKYNAHQARGKRSEAITLLNSIALHQERYFSLHRTYASDIADLTFTADSRLLYEYTIQSGNVSSFTLRATSKEKLCAGAANYDVVELNQDGDVTYPTDGLRDCT